MFEKRYKSHHEAEKCYGGLLKKERSSLDELYEYLEGETLKATDNAIYIHVPFCDKICSFCNMSRTLSKAPKDTFVEDLLRQIEIVGSKKAFRTAEISAVYFGGGTPTTLAPKHFEAIINSIKTNFNLKDDVEITSETTLHNLTDEHINSFNKVGVNRISIGIQTFQNEGRKFFNRTYNKNETIDKLKNIKSRFNGLICIDKIYNYPNETKEMLLDDIKQIIDLEIDSVSFYSLMIIEGSALSKTVTSEELRLGEDQKAHDLFVETLLSNKNYELIELTKIIRKGRDTYKYMSIRNNNGNTIPLGKGSGGKIDSFGVYVMDFERIMVAKSTKDYEEVAHKIYGLWQKDVVLKEDIYNLNYLDKDVFYSTIKTFVEAGFILEDETCFKLTPKGLFYGNNIGGELTKSYLEIIVTN